MSVSLRNGVIATGGTSQEALPARLGRQSLIISVQTENAWVNFGESAAADDGELVYFGSIPRVFDVERFPEIGGTVNIVAATTGTKYQIREV